MFAGNKINSGFVLLLLCFWGASSHAVGLGMSLGYESEKWSGDLEHNGNRKITNFGLVVDTKVAINRLFNYRFTISREQNKYDSNAVDRVNLEGIAMTHDFGFGVLRTPNLRLWIGPQIRAVSYRNITSASGVELDGTISGFSVGPVIGLNINLREVVSFTMTTGFHLIGFYSGDYSVYNDNNFYPSYTDFDPDSTGAFFNLGIVFRIQDNY